jgi:hypothetical protein
MSIIPFKDPLLPQTNQNGLSNLLSLNDPNQIIRETVIIVGKIDDFIVGKIDEL